ncbi:hypothetical protein EDD55_10788 [Varunaivibrio sulfuroxidans]|uniref:Uncharacterized protein n=1 Tax=Varunaivibrio sulfuroxidans TaxID=1773489 RepID=A0A4R3J6Z6_9PROT|nr:hypothetical protein EDD55_10788 [Varunaivibrio sulfuroxidans]
MDISVDKIPYLVMGLFFSGKYSIQFKAVVSYVSYCLVPCPRVVFRAPAERLGILGFWVKVTMGARLGARFGASMGDTPRGDAPGHVAPAKNFHTARILPMCARIEK